MDPEKWDKKKIDELFKSMNISFGVTPTFRFVKRAPEHYETIEQVVVRLDEVDAVVESMTSYPTAERMLNDLYGKR